MTKPKSNPFIDKAQAKGEISMSTAIIVRPAPAIPHIGSSGNCREYVVRCTHPRKGHKVPKEFVHITTNSYESRLIMEMAGRDYEQRTGWALLKGQTAEQALKGTRVPQDKPKPASASKKGR